jgi:hypothetical protein
VLPWAMGVERASLTNAFASASFVVRNSLDSLSLGAL